MALNDTLIIDDWSDGWIPDQPEETLSKSAATALENADVRNRFLQTLPGTAQKFTDLPDGFTVISAEQFKFTTPSEATVDLVYGQTSGGIDKLYAKPYLSLSGTWIDEWQDLTENEGTYEADSGTNTTTVVDSQLLSSEDDYYNKWIFYNATRAAGAIVKDYDGASKTLTLSWAITGQTTGDEYWLMRNHIMDNAKTYFFDPGPGGIKFLQRENAIDIVTGSDASFFFNDANKKSDFWLGVLNNYEAFDDTDLNYTGLYLTFKQPLKFHYDNSINWSVETLGAGEQELPVPATNYYIVLPTLVYDGFQESPLYAGLKGTALQPDGTLYNEAVIFNTASRKLRISFSIYYCDDASSIFNYVESMQHDNSGTDSYRPFVVFDRRITSIRLHLAEAEVADGSIFRYNPVSEFRLVGDIPVDDSTWSGSGPSYTRTYDITGNVWDANAGVDISERLGHSSLTIHNTADFIVSARGRVYVGSVYADKQRLDFIFKSPINSDGLNTPNVFPFTSTIDLSLYGITKITGLTEAQGYLVAFGDNQVVRIDGESGEVSLQFQHRGSISDDGAVNINQLIYFAGLEDLYYYHAAQEVVRSIGTGYIKEQWAALSTASRQAAALGFDRRYNYLVIAAGTTVYLYNIPQAYASDLAADTQAIGVWSAYNVGLNFIRFYTDTNGACHGITNDGKVYELFASSVANALIYESPVMQGPFSISAVRLVYNATSTVTVKLFDIEKSEVYPARTYRFKPQSSHVEQNRYEGAYIERLKIRIEGSLGTKISKLILNPIGLESD